MIRMIGFSFVAFQFEVLMGHYKNFCKIFSLNLTHINEYKESGIDGISHHCESWSQLRRYLPVNKAL